MAIDKINATALLDGGVDSDDIATGAVDLNHLSATGTKDATTFLRGDNSFQVVDTTLVADTTPQLGGDLDGNGNTIDLSSNTTAWTPPSGTTAQRPGTPSAGQMRYNTETNRHEWYNEDDTNWSPIAKATYDIEYLVVAGGGGGGRGEGNPGGDGAGGGGAGGMITGSGYEIVSDTSYSITVGAGGAGSASTANRGNDGSDSVAFGQTAIGGGGGGSDSGAAGFGADGGSGGGASFVHAYGSTVQGGSGTVGQGNDGGDTDGTTSGRAGAGGGGKSTAGSSNSGSSGGAGGAGTGWYGTNYAGGGGGGTVGSGGSGGAGGAGGGGQGGTVASSAPVDGVDGKGGGGGGGSGAGSGGATTVYNTGADGGDGVVIVRYPSPQRGQGGTVTEAGGFIYHTFTSSGTFTG